MTGVDNFVSRPKLVFVGRLSTYWQLEQKSKVGLSEKSEQDLSMSE